MKLNRSLLNSEFNFNGDLEIGITHTLTEKVLQFGEGNFLRAFVDYMIDELNSNKIFNGSIVVIQPIEHGMVSIVNEQDGLYTIILRGLENGKKVVHKKIITSVSRGINPYIDFKEYMKCIENPELRFIVSNTTESGISYRESDRLADEPPISFPAKITKLLYERFKFFNGENTKGFIFIPCELIDYNGSELKNIVLRYAKEWSLGGEFMEWINTANHFTNTLVDRIVTGYPKDEVESLTQELGYKDSLLNTAEIFHFFVIEGPKELSEELPFHKIGLNVVWTNDATPYKLRKVRILNGAHTMSVLAAYLCGKDTVGDIMEDDVFVKFLQKGIFEEIMPTLDIKYSDLKSFADAVFDRFANPYIKHYLLSIALNSVSKYKTRVLPSILQYIERKKCLPEVLTLSFASLIYFYNGKEIKDNCLIGIRNDEKYKIEDDIQVLEFFKNVWQDYYDSMDGIYDLVIRICERTEFWGTDLNIIPDFSVQVSDYLSNIMKNGVYSEVKRVVDNE